MKHILFDLDGTLIDSAPSILSCFARVLERQGIQPECELTNSLVGPPLKDTLKRISGVTDEALLTKLVTDFKTDYDETGYRETREYSGVTEVLSHLAAEEFHLYVVTNKRIVPTIKILDMLSWTGMFEGVYSPDFFSPPLNPKERVLLWAREVHGIKVNMGLYVGDREEDLEAANAGRIGFLGAQWGYGDWSDDSKDKLDFAANLDELHQFIRLRAEKI